MPNYVVNIFISAKTEGFNLQDSQQDSLKMNHFEGVMLLLFRLHPARTFCVTVSSTHEDVCSAALHMNDSMPLI